MNNNHRLCLAEDGRTQYKIGDSGGSVGDIKICSRGIK